VVQFAAAGLFALVFALAFETMRVEWATDFIIAITWLVLVLSVATVALLMWLIRRGEAGKTASLFYLVPPCVAFFGWLLFGETLGAVALVGMGVTIAGVALATR